MGEVYTFIVNGQKIETSEEKNLLDFLRDDLGLISIKNGCKEGACGTCTILIDGKAMKSCIFTTKKISGKEIETIEGFSEREKAVFAYAFTECGAVQCGFCIPGMVIAAKSLFLKTLNPAKEEVKKAYRDLVKQHHPDKFSNASESDKKYHENRIKEINEAYDKLSKDFS